MKRLDTTRGFVLATGLVVMLASGCVSDPTNQSGDSGSEEDSVVNVHLYQEPTPDFGPIAPVSGGDYVPSTLMFDSLMTWDENNELVPRLAEEYSVSDDGTTFTFKLRDDLKWSDGEPLTADDLVFTYNVVANPASGAATAPNYAAVAGVKELAEGTADSASGFSAPDDQTFVVEASEPNVGLLTIIGTTLVIPEHVLGDVPIDKIAKNEYFSSPTATSGPFKFASYKTDQYVELDANENYYRDVSVDKVYLKTVTQDVATAQLGTDELDIVQISSTDLKSVEDMDGVATTTAKDPGFSRIAVNIGQPRFQDPRVRRAMLYAIDRQGIVDTVLSGHGKVVNTPFKDDAVSDQLETYEYDPQKAKKLLADAGWDSSKPVRLSYVPGTRDRDTTATIVQDNLAAVGIKVKLDPTTPADNLANLTSDDPNDMDMTLYAGGNYSDPANVAPITSCATRQPQGANNGRFCDQDLDRIMAKANTITDEGQRMELYRQASEIENEMVSQIWLYETELLWAYNERVKNFVPGGDLSRSSLWNAPEWRVQE